MFGHAAAFYVMAQGHLKRQVIPEAAGSKVNADFKKALEAMFSSQ
jgi:hypothetical protein